MPQSHRKSIIKKAKKLGLIEEVEEKTYKSTEKGEQVKEKKIDEELD